MPRKAYELVLESEFRDRVINPLIRGSAWPISETELIWRWLCIGLAHDMQKPMEQSDMVLKKFVRLIPK